MFLRKSFGTMTGSVEHDDDRALERGELERREGVRLVMRDELQLRIESRVECGESQFLQLFEVSALVRDPLELARVQKRAGFGDLAVSARGREADQQIGDRAACRLDAGDALLQGDLGLCVVPVLANHTDRGMMASFIDTYDDGQAIISSSLRFHQGGD